MEEFRRIRAELVSRIISKPIVIYREDELFKYFCEDERSDAVLIDNGEIKKIGSKLIDPEFAEELPKNYCCPSMSFMHRKCNETCDDLLQESFSNPLISEIELLKENQKEIRENVITSLQENMIGSYESEIQKKLMGDLVSNGYELFYSPIIAGDMNSKEIWHRASDYKPENILYVEVSAIRNGLSLIFSDTFIIKQEGKYIENYSSLLRAEELIRENFVEGNSTKMLSGLEPFRNPDIYLTTPLFPYSYIMIPGEEKIIHSLDTSVFDLWVTSKDFSLRKKVLVIAGSYSASIL